MLFRRFPKEAENVTVSITFRAVDTNFTPLESAPVDSTEEVFDATSNYNVRPTDYTRLLLGFRF